MLVAPLATVFVDDTATSSLCASLSEPLVLNAIDWPVMSAVTLELVSALLEWVNGVVDDAQIKSIAIKST